MMRFRTVLFDLDGTLIDSGAIILASMRHAAETVLGRAVPEARLAAAVIGGARLVEQMRTLDEERFEELVTVYREHNYPLHAGLKCCSGMLDVVVQLRREGRKLGIVTAKRRVTVRLAFDVIPLEPLFETVVCADDTERHKPHPEPLLTALERLGAEPAEAAYVGDSPFDIQAAKAAGVHAIAVTWGGIHEEEHLAREDPDALVHTTKELIAALG